MPPKKVTPYQERYYQKQTLAAAAAALPLGASLFAFPALPTPAVAAPTTATTTTAAANKRKAEEEEEKIDQPKSKRAKKAEKKAKAAEEAKKAAEAAKEAEAKEGETNVPITDGSGDMPMAEATTIPIRPKAKTEKEREDEHLAKMAEMSFELTGADEEIFKAKAAELWEVDVEFRKLLARKKELIAELKEISKK